MRDIALQMADELDRLGSQYDSEIAAELRRLHDLVTEDSILLRRQRDEIAQLGQAIKRAIERNNELKAELAEQARVNGLGGEREARLVAVNSELVAALIEIEWSNNTEWQRDRARAALAKAGASK